MKRGGIVAILLAAALTLTVAVYWPATHGGYVFDDYANILENKDVHVHSLDWESLKTAAYSSPSPVLIRPLAMLSFGMDWYIGGGDPFQMKVVNLAIHLLNGVLLFALLRRISRIAAARRSGNFDHTHADMLALCVTAAWLLAPINFTAVGYIVQRMESLCQTFVLAGLYGYAGARQRMLAGKSGLSIAFLAIALGTFVGALAKESAVLLPLYALALEWILFRFATRQGRPDARVYALHAVIAIVPAGAAAIWALIHYLPAGAWSGRSFTLTERLLTEPRILLDYVRWSLLPTPDALALYHDQIPLSRSLFDPLSTMLCLVALVVAACAVPLLKRARPLAALGIAWFLCAHLLTGTIVPLELVFEHRNYFASIGLYLFVFSFLFPDTGTQMRFVRSVTCVALFALFAGVTWVRAMDWSNPVSFALSEAQKNPDSPRTAYELGRTYVVLSGYRPNSPFVDKARDALERAASMPGADALSDQGLLMLSGRMHQPTSDAVWMRMQNKLASQPLSAQNISALSSLGKCAADGDCDFPPEQMVQSFLAVLRRSPASAPVLSIYANYAINVLHDQILAIDLARESVQRVPHDLQARKNLLLLLQVTGHREEAVSFYEETLRDLPDVTRDNVFRAWAQQLLYEAPTPEAPAPVPQSTP